MRVGLGYDVHALVENRKLILGGVEIPFELGLLGHSDADVLTHAIMDAILGAIGKGDIGGLFPDTANEFKDISSLLLLERVIEEIKLSNMKIINIDAIIIAQKPKMAPYIGDMKKRLACVMGIEENQINIKATTTEKLGFEGRGEGISSQAVVLLENDN
ncbi:MAG: 2-C-methyl-D-erythritol 2,4-cyclodiphosphate synthase [Tissierellales bacterium]|jgi:2-C-methyl-D-erythritol 2,4-cyclodiphosphate synthase|nr:2-C-methyl-D-erythritol 2,4-cyclodiphosphate synthase [Tissierellales bacterium]